jgi:hypothetical protein
VSVLSEEEYTKLKALVDGGFTDAIELYQQGKIRLRDDDELFEWTDKTNPAG